MGSTTTDRPAHTARVPWFSSWLAAPYLAVLFIYATISSHLAVPGVLICVTVYLTFERIHRGHPGRYPAGWLVSLALLVPCVYLYVVERLAVVVIVAAPIMLGIGLSLVTAGRFGRWWTRQPVFGSLIYLVLTAGLLLGSTGHHGLPALNDDLLFELYAAPMTVHLKPQEMQAAVDVVDTAIRHYRRGAQDAIPGPVHDLDSQLPLALQRDLGEVHVTLWLDRKASLRGRAAQGSLADSLAVATSRALDGTRRHGDWVDGADRIRIQVDIADRPVRIRRRIPHQVILAVISLFRGGDDDGQDDRPPGLMYQMVYEIEPGVDGLVIRDGQHEAVLLPGDAVTRGLLTPRVPTRSGKVEALLERVSRDAGGGRRLWADADTELYKFRTECFGRPEPGGAVIALYRGNAPVESVDSGSILVGLGEAGRWLLRTVQPDGKFDYEYYPNTDTGSSDYNIVRHAGSVYGLFHMYHLALVEPELHDDANDYLEAGLRAMGWVHDNLAAPRKSRDPALVALIDDRGRASSGAAALTLLSMLERPHLDQVSHPVLREHLERPDAERLEEGLGLFLLAMIDDRGWVFTNYRDTLKSDRVDREPLYYPGECMLALVRFHVATGDQRWLQGARRIGDWQVQRYDDLRPNPDHWVMQALWELYEVTGDETYARTCLRMGDRYASEQFPPQWPPFPDYLGAYRRFNDLPRTTRACSRSEAMGAVMHTAWALDIDATAYEDALLRAARHLLENQWRPKNSYYLADPDRARGAIRMGLVDNQCRIDNNQHAVVGLHHALAAARHREGVADDATAVLPPPPSEEQIRACRARFGEVEDLPADVDVPPTPAVVGQDRTP